MTTQPAVIDVIHGAKTMRVPRLQLLFQFLVLGILVLLLINFKGTAGFNKIRQTHTTGTLSLPALQAGNVSGMARSFEDTARYLKIVWPAMVFGILISAAMRTSLMRTPLKALWGKGSLRDQLTGAIAGVPLMLCSCCVAPIFPSVYQRSRKLAPALALALASPSLNPVALALTFMLFPMRVASGRLVMALVLVLAGSAFVAGLMKSKVAVTAPEEEPGRGWRDLFKSYFNSLAYISLRTVPLVLIGIWVSSLWMPWLMSNTAGVQTGMRLVTIAIVALIALLITLPTLFEIPLALTLLAAGAPAGAAAAVLLAGPAINLPSLLVIGKHSSWRIAVALALVVWVVATAGGLIIN